MATRWSNGTMVKVLVAVDSFECTYAALQSLKRRVWNEEPEFMLLKVIEDLANYVQPLPEHSGALASEQGAYTSKVVPWLKAIRDEFRQTYPKTIGHVEVGNVPSTIADVAFEWEADLIVIGSHDLDLATRYALGSIASAVAQLAPCTVEILRYRKLRDLMRTQGEVSYERLVEIAVPPRKILIASDLSPASLKAVDWAAKIEWPVAAAIRLLTVTAPEHHEPVARWFGDIGTVYTKEKHHQEVIEKELEDLGLRLAQDLAFLKIETEMVIGDDPAIEIANKAEEWNANLIVMGAQGRTANADVRVGGTALSVLERAHCSMIIVQQNDSRQPIRYSWKKGITRTA